jgi:hypothetical protein
VINLTGQYVEGSAAYKSLSPFAQAATKLLINATSQILGQITPRLNAAQTNQLIAAYDQGVTGLQSRGYLTAAQVTTLKAVAAGL